MNTRRIRARARERGHGRVVCVQDCDDSCVFFRRGEVQGLHVFASVPPRQFSRPLFTRANTGCNKQNLRPCRDQSGRSAAAEAPLPKRRCRSAVAEAPLRCCPNTISFCLAMDQFSSIFKELRFLFVLLCVAATFA